MQTADGVYAGVLYGCVINYCNVIDALRHDKRFVSALCNCAEYACDYLRLCIIKRNDLVFTFLRPIGVCCIL